MEKIKLNSFITRTLTALILIPVVIAALYFSYPWLLILALIFGAMFAWEWAHMVPSDKPEVYGIIYAVSVAAAILLMSWGAVALFVLGAMLLTAYKARHEEHRFLLVLGVPYIAVGIGSVVWLYFEAGMLLTLWFLIVVWSVDIGGYVVGCNLKGPKLAPKISPNKTWSGLFGGVLFAVLASMVFFKLCSYLNDGVALGYQAYFMTFAAIIAIIAQIGDLVESSIKRHLGLKDSSCLIPGHGGVFDRIDGLIFAAPIVLIVFNMLISFSY